MSLVNCVYLMEKAERNGEAVPAFNIDNLESAIAVSEVMKETGRGFIVQTIPRTLNYGGTPVYPAMMKALMEGSRVDYCMHLDHGDGLDRAVKCVQAGYSSVMFDGSALPFEENISKTSEVRNKIPKSISLEAELGAIGGKEEAEGHIAYTDPDEAKAFFEASGCDTLAIGVGTAHGVYKGVPNIRIDLIEKIKEKTDGLLVLHGASGLSDNVIKDCISAGISKINFATELRQAYTAGIKKGMELNPDCFDPKIYMRTAIEEIKKVVFRKAQLCLKF